MAYMVVNSRYNPFTYDELVKPLVDYTTAYEKQEALADAYATAAANLDALSPDLDSAEYQNYNNWKNELKAASDLLATSGLTPEVRSTLKSLGTRFSTELNPALEKMKTRAELVKEQRAALAKNPNLMFDVDYSATPLGSISPSSTYNTYDLDNILKEVGNDVYSRMSAGESVPSANEYLTRYSAGLSDPDKIAKVNNAISSGMNLGNSTYQQKEFDNYIKKVQATRSRSSSGSSGTYATSGKPMTANTYDGRAINVKYDKGVGEYQIKDKDNKTVTLPENYNESDIVAAYYGGDYGYIQPFGSLGSIGRVSRIETLPNGQSKEIYSINVNGKWMELPRGGQTTKAELYSKLTNGKKLVGLDESERHYRQGNVSDDKITQGLERNGKRAWKLEDVQDYHRLADFGYSSLVSKMEALESIGAEFNVTLYRDNNNNVVGWDIASVGDDINSPIEDEWGA